MHSPGQGAFSHISVWEFGPRHLGSPADPFVSHSLVLCLIPSPHEAEQTVQFDHCVQWAGTKKQQLNYKYGSKNRL